MADINKIGLLVIINDAFLVCRKNSFTSKLIMPGGKIEPGETDRDCLTREIQEELGTNIQLEDIHYYGTYLDKAASDDPEIEMSVEIKLYKSRINGYPVPSSEIIELKWFNILDNRNELSAIIRNKILPALIKNKDLNWSDVLTNRTANE